MKRMSDNQLEKELTIFSELKEVGSPEFFYTRLTARMKYESQPNSLGISFNPIVAIYVLTLLLFVNLLLLEKETNLINTEMNQNIQALAASYDQTISN